MRAEHDAIVVGAGPAGASAAILLARAGWSVALVERHAFPRRKVCGECIAASNLPLLDALGVGEAFDAVAGPELRRVAVMWGRHAIEADLPAHASRRRWGRALGRETLDTLLLDRAAKAGAEVLQPWTVRAVQAHGTDFVCQADGPRRQGIELRAPIVIAAHGSWEQVGRLERSPGATHAPGDLLAFKANFRAARLPAGVLPVLAFPGGYGGMVVGDRGTLTLACCIRRDRLAALRRHAPGRSAAEVVEAYLLACCRGVREALSGARRDGAWLAAGPLRPGVRMPRDGGEVFLVGNAAGEAHPIIGEGMSMAMQSAWLLCERLIGNRGLLATRSGRAAVARDYAAAWRRAFAPRIRLAAVCAHAAMRPAVAGSLLPLLRGWPQALTGAARLAGKVRCAADPARLSPHPIH